MQIEELIEESNKGASIEEIESFEKELNIKLPQDIKELYLKYNGIYFKEDYEIFFRTNVDYGTLVEKISLIRNIIYRISRYKNKQDYDNVIETYFVGKKILPIGWTDTEYYEIGISIDESSKDYGAFFFLPYERENDFCKIADNLQDFLSKFKKVED